MRLNAQIDVALWKTNKALKLTVTGGSAWKLGLGEPCHVTAGIVGSPDQVESFQDAHRRALGGATARWSGSVDECRWDAILCPDRDAEGRPIGVVAAAWRGSFAAADPERPPEFEEVVPAEADDAEPGFSRAEPQDHALTPIEADVLRLTAEGLTSAQIAVRLNYSVKNIEYHIGNLRVRLEAANRTSLVAHAYALGVLRAGVWPPMVSLSALRPREG